MLRIAIYAKLIDVGGGRIMCPSVLECVSFVKFVVGIALNFNERKQAEWVDMDLFIYLVLFNFLFTNGVLLYSISMASYRRFA